MAIGSFFPAFRSIKDNQFVYLQSLDTWIMRRYFCCFFCLLKKIDWLQIIILPFSIFVDLLTILEYRICGIKIVFWDLVGKIGRTWEFYLGFWYYLHCRELSAGDETQRVFMALLKFQFGDNPFSIFGPPTSYLNHLHVTIPSQIPCGFTTVHSAKVLMFIPKHVPQIFEIIIEIKNFNGNFLS